MDRKVLCAIVFLFCVVETSESLNLQNVSYVDALLEVRNLLSQNSNITNGPLLNLVLSDSFLQLTQALSQPNLLQNARQLLSNFTMILSALQNMDGNQMGNVDLQLLFQDLSRLGAFTNANGTFGNISGMASAAISDTLSAAARLNIQTHCLRTTFQVLVALGSGQQWALRMLDASAKVPTDLLNLNIDFFGSFDECVAINPTQHDIHFNGLYCTAIIPTALPQIPGYNPNIQIGLCVPDVCTEEDILKMTNFLLSLLPMGDTTFAVGSVKCQLNEIEYSTNAIIALCICGAFILMMTMATIFDITMIQWPKHKRTKSELLPSINGTKKEIIRMEDKKPIESGLEEMKVDKDNVKTVEPNEKYNVQGEWKFAIVEQPVPKVATYKPGRLGKILLSFSVYSNGKKLLSTHQPPGTLTAMNGIRFLSMTWIILGHTYALGNANVKNLITFLPELIKRVSFQAILNALVAVDTFFALSGLLLTYIIMKEMEKNKGKGGWPKFWFMFYFHRFWRLTPPYMLIMGVYVSLTPYFYNGPQYPQDGFYLDKNACADTWWKNLLYVNNFIKPEEMCMAWTWYLANDMQFYVVSPLMLLPLSFFPVVGVIVTMVVLLAITIITAVLSRVNNWAPSVYGGGEHPPGEMFFDYYIKPYCRMGPYVIGMLTGYVLYKTKCKVNINKYLNLLIWAVAITLACLILFGLHKPINGDPMNDHVVALYLATHRTVWGACVCWVIFACATGHGGYINTLLSWNAFIPLARLTYCTYLFHPILVAVYSWSLRVPQYWTDLQITYLFLGHLVLSYAIAFVLSLAFESPMMGMEKVILGGRKEKKI